MEERPLTESEITIITNFNEQGISPNDYTESGVTFFQLVVVAGELGVANYLLKKKGANIHIPVGNGAPLLRFVIDKAADPIPAIKFLAENGANLDESTNGITILLAMVVSGKTNFVRLLLELQANKNAKITEVANEEGDDSLLSPKGFNSIHLAILANHELALVELLLDADVDKNAQSEKGVTPLFVACVMDRTEHALLLIRRGANVRLSAIDGHTPLHQAAIRNNPVLINALIDAGALANAVNNAGVTPLYLAAGKGCISSISALLNRGAQVNAGDANGCTSLHAAVMGDYPTAVNTLLDNGADIEARVSGATPLHLAAHANNFNMVVLLLSRKADVNGKDEKHATPLDSICSMKSHFAIAQKLILSGSNLMNIHRALSDYDNTTIANIVHFGYPEILEFIINNTDFTKEKTRAYRTPFAQMSLLHVAAYANNQPMVAYLLSIGVDINVEINLAIDTFKILSREHREKYSEMNSKIDDIIKDSESFSPLALTVSLSDPSTVKLLLDRSTITFDLKKLLKLAEINPKKEQIIEILEKENTRRNERQPKLSPTDAKKLEPSTISNFFNPSSEQTTPQQPKVSSTIMIPPDRLNTVYQPVQVKTDTYSQARANKPPVAKTQPSKSLSKKHDTDSTSSSMSSSTEYVKETAAAPNTPPPQSSAKKGVSDSSSSSMSSSSTSSSSSEDDSSQKKKKGCCLVM